MEKRSAECLETVKREHTVPQRPVFIRVQWSALPLVSRREKRKRLSVSALDFSFGTTMETILCQNNCHLFEIT